MSHRYAPVVNDRDAEMHAAFDDSDDDESDDEHAETRPLNPTPHSPAPGAYNFESVDYDFPPPGSPPRPSAVALPNDIGNSNGVVPDFSRTHRPDLRNKWYQRVLPASVTTRLGLAPQRPTGPVGGGINNDGVFANVTAKPSAPVRVQDADGVYVVPEDSQSDAPPSYASAQADAVPPYWETTIHAPFSPDGFGDLLIDSMPTGSLFSFCWNLLVSVSFQFVGFLLTYLLHTSHAARLGSRAGLGITLIQYGFSLRNKLDDTEDTSENSWGGWPSDNTGGDSSQPGTPHHTLNATWSTPLANMTSEEASQLVASATTEWLSFFLMTIGWFLLLTSVLGFWRVKRWEQGLLASRREQDTPAPQTSASIVSRLESSVGLRGMSRIDLLRQGFGFRSAARTSEEGSAATGQRAEEGNTQEMEPMMPPSSGNPDRDRRRAQVLENDLRLQRDLRSSGLI